MEIIKKERTLISFDWVVKYLLRSKANFEIVEGFLSELLKRPITITGVLESQSNKTSSDDKTTAVDIFVEDDKGELILIELQFDPEPDYFQRILCGVSKAIVDHIIEGDTYDKVKKIYSISIVYFDLGQGKDYIYHGKTVFEGLNEHDVLMLSKRQQKKFNGIKIGDIYPEYYIIKIKNFNDVAKNTLEEWIYFLKNSRIKDGFKAKGLRKAAEELDYNRLSAEEKAEYDQAQKAKSHYHSQMLELLWEAEEKFEPIIAEKDKVIAEKEKERNKALAEKRKAEEEKEKAEEEKEKANKALEEKEREIAELKRLLNKK
jgi:hypothetical protein